MQRIFATIVLTLVLSACASTPTVSPDDEFNMFASQVETEIRATDKTGSLWRDTQTLLQDARAAQKAGRREDAMRLARQALSQTRLAQQQARDNANAAPSYPAP